MKRGSLGTQGVDMICRGVPLWSPKGGGYKTTPLPDNTPRNPKDPEKIACCVTVNHCTYASHCLVSRW